MGSPDLEPGCEVEGDLDVVRRSRLQLVVHEQGMPLRLEGDRAHGPHWIGEPQVAGVRAAETQLLDEQRLGMRVVLEQPERLRDAVLLDAVDERRVVGGGRTEAVSLHQATPCRRMSRNR